MKNIFLRSSSLYVLFTFFCFVFILIFYDGYRNIHFDVSVLYGRGMDPTQAIEVARHGQYDAFMEEVAFMNDRTNLGDVGGLDKRHKLRWAYKTAEAKIYAFVAANSSVKMALLAKHLHYSLVVLVGLLFTLATVRRLRGGLDFNSLAFLCFAMYSYVALVSTVHRIFDQHSFIEMAAVAAGVYFALCKRWLPFLVALVVAVANRESAAVFGIIWALINWRDRLFWLPVVLAPALLALINLDLLMLPELYAVENFMVTRTNVGYINMANLGDVSASLIAFTALKTFAFLAPALVFVPAALKVPVGRRLLAVGGFYLLMLLFGTILGNLLPYAMIVPIIFALWAVAYPAKTAAAQ